MQFYHQSQCMQQNSLYLIDVTQIVQFKSAISTCTICGIDWTEQNFLCYHFPPLKILHQVVTSLSIHGYCVDDKYPQMSDKLVSAACVQDMHHNNYYYHYYYLSLISLDV